MTRIITREEYIEGLICKWGNVTGSGLVLAFSYHPVSNSLKNSKSRDNLQPLLQETRPSACPVPAWQYQTFKNTGRQPKEL